MLDGDIHVSGTEGLITGWLRSAETDRPRVALIVPEGRAPIRVIADAFRADLFENGEGHGHYGFLARFRPRDFSGAGQRGAWRVTLVDEATRTVVSQTAFGAPRERAAEAPLTVERLIGKPARWTTRQIAAQAGNLCVEETLEALGPRPFVDRVARYVFGTEPDRASLAGLVEAVRTGRITGTQAFRAMLQTAESLDGGPKELPGVHEGLYPFFRERGQEDGQG